MVNEIIIHCSASQLPSEDNVEAIRNLHILAENLTSMWNNKPCLGRGFREIGYHYIITKDGNTFQGRDVGEIGAHCKDHNSHSIGICLTGDTYFSNEQFSSLRMLVKMLCNKYNITKEQVRLHRDHNQFKTCPNFSKEDAGI
jgi:N-acetylmuramoyl-L-alanine amidase